MDFRVVCDTIPKTRILYRGHRYSGTKFSTMYMYLKYTAVFY
jgi:hypothetical protein